MSRKIWPFFVPILTGKRGTPPPAKSNLLVEYDLWRQRQAGITANVRNYAPPGALYNGTLGLTTAMPGFDATTGALTFDGGDYVTVDALAAAFTGEDKPISVLAVYRSSSYGSSQALWDNSNLGIGLGSHHLSGYTTVSNNARTYLDSWDGTTRKLVPVGAGYAKSINTWYSNLWASSGLVVAINQGGAATDITATDIDVGTISLNAFSLGAIRTTSISGYFTGSLQYFAVWNKQLNAAERAQAYARAKERCALAGVII